MVQKNEQALCEALIRHLETQTLGIRSDVTHPETDGSGPPVETRFRLGSEKYAIEHTLLEPFEQSIQMAAEFQAFASEIAETLNGTLPKPGIYDLLFPLHPTQGRHRRTHSLLRAKIIDWVRSTAAELHAECPERPSRDRHPYGYEGSRTTVISGLELTLKRRAYWAHKDRHDGVLFLARLVDSDTEPSRRVRVQRALDDKLEKLSACREDGDETILILEFADTALTNHVVLAEALQPLLAGRTDVPDHIYIADTTGETTWDLYQVLAGEVYSIEVDAIEINPSLLNDRRPEIANSKPQSGGPCKA
ncbi:hypothetical protein [Agrobacterium vitis]|uniref:hypothetical protein n=1 Tax=Agrobacterium vitis TaxID=373 RepID=UPI000871FB44|nr:hypothetical protein [Agrobacterium vitis]MCE6076779.1 hypothetical protein [Agrobacterium vitis]MCM2453441.1 hypothetical protein [Agrobacterium vitis]MCM2471042.1 hypothetical protein [Agrobacterium vitis]MUO71163.1 hypothetical protein [Agrobacterium vitis]MUO84374.1 hypothetical protein [Agrobacterium vitis]